MGTKAKCIKCGEEKWINTTKLKNIHDTLGIRPKDWLKNNYVCNGCQSRIDLIKNTTPEEIKRKINEFSMSCKAIYSGLYANKTITKESYDKFINGIKNKVLSVGISSFQLLKYKNIIIGMSIDIPIIGKIKIDFIV